MDANNTIDDAATDGAFSAEQQALIDAANAERTGTAPETVTQDSGVPDKFRNEDGSVNTEALLKSYTELEKKLGAPKEGEQEAPSDGDPAPEGEQDKPKEEEAEVKTEDSGKRSFNGVEITDEIQAKANDIYAEMAKNGGVLSDAGYDYLKTTFKVPEGVPKDMVQDWLNTKMEAATLRAASQQQATEAQVNEALATVGGRDEFQKMSDWAVDNLDPKEIEDLNAALASGSPREVKLALKALKSEYDTKAIIPPAGVIGAEDGDNGSGAGDIFRSENEIAEAMGKIGADGRVLYKTDDEYRRSVEAKVERSTAFLASKPRKR